jgi:hypothetical protein
MQQAAAEARVDEWETLADKVGTWKGSRKKMGTGVYSFRTIF